LSGLNIETDPEAPWALEWFSKMTEAEQDTVVDALARILEQVNSGTDVVDGSA
jgi:hypothetical protein